MKKLLLLLLITCICLPASHVPKRRMMFASRRPYPALFRAVKEGNIKQVVTILNNESGAIDVRDNNNRTALYVALENNQYDIAELLLMRGINKNVTSRGATTALITAIEDAKPEFVELLLRHNADPYVQVTRWDAGDVKKDAFTLVPGGTYRLPDSDKRVIKIKQLLDNYKQEEKKQQEAADCP